jgi:membrane protein implicated in regulation of membrane protease activity
MEMGFPSLFFCLSIACGAGAGFIVSFYTLPIETQASAFFIVTLLSFCCLRMLAIKIQSKSGYKTGTEKLRGAIAIVLTEAGLSPGSVHIAGTTWSAQSLHGTKINAGTMIRIIDIKNTTLIVEIIKEYEENHVQ